ncbi:hypothetical protein BGZ83_011595 [Gryganskiella cystojenkinii]|nr:hypothetical protein BGZ83_011595 [Gryganskiella cystojenkinii]
MNTASPRTRQTRPASPHLFTSTDNLILPGVIGATVEGPRTPMRTPTRRVNSDPFQSPRLPLRPIRQPSSGYVDEVVPLVNEPSSGSRTGSPSHQSSNWRKKYRPHDTPIALEKLPQSRLFSSEDDERDDEDEISSWAGGASPTRPRGIVNLALDFDSVHDENGALLEPQEQFEQDDDEFLQEEEPVLTQSQLDEEEAERIKELNQLGFIKRITRSLKDWGTPNKNGSLSASEDEDSDSRASATSARARARKGNYAVHRQARLTRKAPLRTLSRTLSVKRDLPKSPRSQQLPGTPALRNLDSGVAMSHDGYDDRFEDKYQDTYQPEDRGMTSPETLMHADDDYGVEDFPPLGRQSTPRRGSPHIRDNYREYPPMADSESEYESLDVDILDHEAAHNYPSIPPSPTHEFYEIDSKPRRHRLQSKRVYPWHVVWRGLVYYTQGAMDLYNATVTACVSFLWFTWNCIRVFFTWPWTQRHKARRLALEWYEAGVAVGLLSPGALFGVALLAFAVLGGHRSNGGTPHESSWNEPGGRTDSVLNNTRSTNSFSPIGSTLSRVWDVITWRSDTNGAVNDEPKPTWSDWVPSLPSLDLWLPFKKTDRKAPRLQIPEGDIKSLEELEARIEWIQNALTDLRRADGKLAEGLKDLEGDVHDKLSKESSQVQDLLRRFDHVPAEKEKLAHDLDRRFHDEVKKRDKQVDELGHRFNYEVTERDKKVNDLERRIQQKIAEKERQVSELQNFVESKLHETDAKVEDMSVWIGGIEHKLERVEDDVTTLKKYISKGGWIDLKILEIVQDQIPRYLVVSKDPKTGKLSIPGSFWDSARELFMTSDQVQKSIDEKLSVRLGSTHEASDSDANEPTTGGWTWGSKGSKTNKKKTGQPMTWDEFLGENRVPIANYVDGRITTVSRAVFLNLVKTEATEIWKGIEKNVVALLEKQGKLKGRAPTQHGSAPGVFGQSTELTDVERDLVNTLIDEALNKYSADVLAKVDYALYSAGGRIIPRLTSDDYRHGSQPKLLERVKSRFFFPLPHREKPSRTVIEPDVHAGQCWPMKGQRGQVAVRLARQIVVTEVTIEHADPSVVLDSGSAPREIEIWSLTTDTDAAPTSPYRPGASSADDNKSGDENKKTEANVEASSSSKSTDGKEAGYAWNYEGGPPWHGSKLLTTVVYDASAGVLPDGTPLRSFGDIAPSKKSNPRQTFSIPLSKQSEPSQGIVFRIKSNWGHPAYTCVYRVRVHGYEQ